MFFNSMKRTTRTYICWVCLEEEAITKETEFNWISHCCGCNLQIHKACYLKWFYNSMDKIFIQRVVPGRSSDNALIDVRKECLLRIIDKHRSFQVNKHIWNLFPLPIKLLTKPYYRLLNTVFLYPQGSLFGTYVQSIENAQDILLELPKSKKCPQCRKRDFIPASTAFIRESLSLSIAYKIDMIIQNFFGIVLTASTILNPRKLFFKLGLHQLRAIFPESFLKILLNISTTRALDVFSETANGLHGISTYNKFIVYGFPFFLASLVTPNNTFINELHWIYPIILSLRVKVYNGKIKTNIMSACLLSSKILIWLCDNFFNPFLSKRFIKSMYESADFKSLRSLLFGSTEEWYNYFTQSEGYNQLFRSIVWPFLGSFAGSHIYDLIVWLQEKAGFKLNLEASHDEYKMIFNFSGCASLAFVYKMVNIHFIRVRLKELRDLTLVVEQAVKE